MLQIVAQLLKDGKIGEESAAILLASQQHGKAAFKQAVSSSAVQ
jgi:hypothetical protein